MTLNQAFSACSFIAFVMSFAPFPWHMEASNTGICLYMLWVGLSNLAYSINSIIWDGNVVNWAPVWCDITTRFQIGVSVAIPATTLCIQRRLYYVISRPLVTITPAEKRRIVMVDAAIGLGIPVLEMVLEYVAQGHRYDIYEDVGCFPVTIRTPMGAALVFAWPLVIGIVSAVYGCLNIYHIWIKRRNIKSILDSTAGGMSYNRYIRLVLLSGVDIIFTIPLATWALMEDWPILPWPGWTSMHYDFSRVGQIPATVWRSNYFAQVALEMSRWSSVLCALTFFCFFGISGEAGRHYKFVFKSISKKVGIESVTTRTLGRSRSKVSEGFNLLPASSSSNDSASSQDRPPASDKSRLFESTYGKSRSAIAFQMIPGMDTKQRSEDATSLDLEKSLPVKPQICLTRSESPPMPLDSEPGREAWSFETLKTRITELSR